jgi:hypothetical protein
MGREGGGGGAAPGVPPPPWMVASEMKMRHEQLKRDRGQLTLEVRVEPFGLGASDVARPPPRVGVARRPLQHLDMNRSMI